MSANNYIQIKEISPERYSVSEKDYESEGEICALGTFDSMKSAVEKAEVHIREIEHGVEYGIRFSLIGEEKQQDKKIVGKDFDMKKAFAFIDVQNTETTTRQILGFSVDWGKLFDFLKTDWKCEKVFFYSGIDVGDSELEKEFKKLADDGCVVRAKLVFAYKNKDKNIDVKCPKCEHDFEKVVDMGYNRKSNCDVDLTVDAMEIAGPNAEFYIFTGDGDFEYLIKKVIEKGTVVHIVSSAKKIKSGPRYSTSRFSTKLRKLTEEEGKPVDFLNIDNLKMKIKKEKAAKRDLF
jgi:uncharacterized LabA/DUF88 family protein